MTTITFDMLELVEKLKTAGFDQKQSEIVVRVIADAQESLISNLTLDHRLKETELRIDSRFERVDGELKLLRWMVGMSIALSTGTIALLTKLLFLLPH